MGRNHHLAKDERLKETPEETKERYKKNKKEQEAAVRLQRRKEIEDNNVANRRLSFLTNIFKAYGYNNSMIAKKVGTTQQSMSWSFNVADDCRLSQAEEFLSVLGLDLKVEIRKDEKKNRRIDLADKKEGNNSGVKYSIEGDIIGDVHWINPKMPDYINECTPDKRMYFLATYIPSLGLNMKQLMEMTDMEMTSLRYIFAKDDIKISRIFDIARSTGGEIIWKVNNKKP